MEKTEHFLSELEAKHYDTYRRLVMSGYLPALAGEGATLADLLRWECKLVIEAIETSALWIVDTDSLEMKRLFAETCGRHASHLLGIEERLAALGLAPGTYDPRQGGYSKFFAFCRSLQTGEERAAAGLFAAGAMAVERLKALTTVCEERNDTETATLVREVMLVGEQRRLDLGREKLLHLATAEDSQARARRAVYRSVELFSEIHDTATIRRAVGRANKKA